MNKKPTKVFVNQVLAALRHTNRKVVSLDMLSRLVGVYSDSLGETLSYFEPMIRMDPSINCRDLVPAMKTYVDTPIETKSKKKRKTPNQRIYKKDLSEFTSLNDFVYKKMTGVTGLVDTSTKLSDKDLLIMKKLLEKEIQKRKKKKKR